MMTICVYTQTTYIAYNVNIDWTFHVLSQLKISGSHRSMFMYVCLLGLVGKMSSSSSEYVCLCSIYHAQNIMLTFLSTTTVISVRCFIYKYMFKCIKSCYNAFLDTFKFIVAVNRYLCVVCMYVWYNEETTFVQQHRGL